MNNRKVSAAVCVLVGTVMTLAPITGCSMKQSWGSTESGVSLEYRLPRSETLRYRMSNEVSEAFDQSSGRAETNIADTCEFSIQLKGIVGVDQKLGVTIDSVEFKVRDAEKEHAPDVSALKGKCFDMALSFLGKEKELDSAESIRFEVLPGEEQCVANRFQSLFPDMAGKPLMPGDTWTTREMITETTSNGELRITLECTNTLEGFETVRGLECAKVKTVVKGTFQGERKEGIENLSLDGTVNGGETYYFAYKEGYLVSMTASSKAEGSLLSEQEGATPYPMTREVSLKAELL